MYKQPSPTVSMRFCEKDKALLSRVAKSLHMTRTDAVLLLLREARHILPELKTLAKRPRPYNTVMRRSLANMPKAAQTAQ